MLLFFLWFSVIIQSDVQFNPELKFGIHSGSFPKQHEAGGLCRASRPDGWSRFDSVQPPRCTPLCCTPDKVTQKILCVANITLPRDAVPESKTHFLRKLQE